jgi:hypothetical protein
VIQFENVTEMLSTTVKHEKLSAHFVTTAGYMALLCTVFGTVTTTVSFYIIIRAVYFY